MAEVINTNVFDANKKFVDFSGLDYFWTKAKTYIDGVDASMSAKVVALENTVGDSTKGLVKDVKSIQDELNSLSGGAGSIATQIDNAIAALDLPNTYDAKGAAADALTDAKSYVDGKVDGKFDAAGTAAGLDSAMDARVKVLEAIDHDKLAADAASAAVAGVIDGAPEKFDTLKEVAQWIADSESAASAADLVTRVAALEAIDHDAYVDADAQVLTDAKAYADGLVMVDGVAKFDAAGSAATAEANAIADAAGKYQVKGDYEAVGVAAGLVDGLANGAVKANTDAIAVINGTAETEGSIAKAKADAIADAEAKLKAVTDTLKSAAFVEVATLEATMDSKDATNLEAAKTYAATYTDNLFDSFKFAANSDIDALFA